jgi:glycosyltransferase involved in cell wall biosynthesis
VSARQSRPARSFPGTDPIVRSLKARGRVLFLTVMPSPYQQELFYALHSDGRMDIRVLYYSRQASDRNWSSPSLRPYERILFGQRINVLGPSAHINPTILSVLSREPSDLVIISDYSAPTAQIAMRYLNLRRKLWVFWGEVPGFCARGRVGSLVRRQLQQPIAKGAAAIAAIGSEAVEVYRGLFPNIRVFNVPYFCALENFRTAARERWKRKKETVDVLFSGQLIKRKGVDVLISAFARVSHQVPELRLRLLGTGPALPNLTRLVPPELRNRIEFLGFQQPNAIPEIFAAADIFVLASRHDGWGVVVNEALGAGLPLIVSDRVGARDLVKHGCNGLITRAGDIDSLASALLTLGQSGELRKSYSCSSKLEAAHWSLDEGVRRWNELYERVMTAAQQ